MRSIVKGTRGTSRKGDGQKLETEMVMTSFMFWLGPKDKEKLLASMAKRRHSTVGETIKALIVADNRKRNRS